MVFLDESGANLAMGRSHAWLPRGAVLVEPVAGELEHHPDTGRRDWHQPLATLATAWGALNTKHGSSRGSAAATCNMALALRSAPAPARAFCAGRLSITATSPRRRCRTSACPCRLSTQLPHGTHGASHGSRNPKARRAHTPNPGFRCSRTCATGFTGTWARSGLTDVPTTPRMVASFLHKIAHP